MRGPVRWLIVVAVAIAAVAAGWLAADLVLRGSSPTVAVNRALIGGPFSLTDQHGRAVTDATFRGKLLLVYFGYTYCPDVCPTELQTMSAALDSLGDKAGAVQPLFITIDPQRDTVAQLADYMTHFHPSFLGLTGSAEQVAAAAKVYRVYYARARDPDKPGKPADPNDQSYLMDHSSFVYLMGRDGLYLTHFAPGADPQRMAETIRQQL